MPPKAPADVAAEDWTPDLVVVLFSFEGGEHATRAVRTRAEAAVVARSRVFFMGDPSGEHAAVP